MTRPAHYEIALDPLDIMKKDFSDEAYRGFLRGNILKYLLRYEYKDGIKDLEKCQVYLKLLMESYDE